MRRKLIDLVNQRANLLEQAEAALQAGNQTEYNSAMEKIGNLNGDIKQVKDLLDEQEKNFGGKLTPAEKKDIASERGNELLQGREVKFTTDEVRRVINSVTLATGTLAEPTGAGSTVRGIPGSAVSSILDQVSVIDLHGMSSYQEPYVITELTANAGKVETLAGTARAASTDPTFGVAEIKPYEVNTTSYVDRNLANLTPANYYDVIYSQAMRALRRKIAKFILNGDAETTHVFQGIKTAKNKAGTAIYATSTVTAIDVNTLDELYFAYGTDDALDPNARLLLTKKNLKALGQIRGTNEKRRLFNITPGENGNVGTITDGGMVIPYTICSDLADTDLLYGGTMNYELGLFGDYSIRVDESVKAVERLLTILGDVQAGGNLVAHHGFVVATLSAG